MLPITPMARKGRRVRFYFLEDLTGCAALKCDVKPQTSHHRVRPDRMFSALNGHSP